MIQNQSLPRPKKTYTVDNSRLGVMFVGGGMNHTALEFAPLFNLGEFKRVELELVGINTDVDDIEPLDKYMETLQIGKTATGGMGAGTDPDLGLKAAMENAEDFENFMKKYNLMLFMGCLGSGTASGVIPYLAETYCKVTEGQAELPLPKQKSALVIVTTPFRREGAEQIRTANTAIQKLRDHNIPLIILDNDELCVNDDDRPLKEMFSEANQKLVEITGRIIRILGKKHNRRNIDRNDIVYMFNQTYKDKSDQAVVDAHFAVGYGKGDKALEDALACVADNRYTGTSLRGCQGLLASIDAKNLTQNDFDKFLSFMAEHRVHVDRKSKIGIDDDYKPMAFENKRDADVVITVIGVGHTKDANLNIEEAVSSVDKVGLAVAAAELAKDEDSAIKEPVTPPMANKPASTKLSIHAFAKADSLPLGNPVPSIEEAKVQLPQRAVKETPRDH